MGDHSPSMPASCSAGCRPPVGQTFMQAPHFRHLARKSGSSSAPGGRMRAGLGRGSTPSEARASGTATTPATPAVIHLRRERSVVVFDSVSAGRKR